MTKPKLHIRWMIRADMPAVLEIENLCFEFPWPEDDFIRCLRQRNIIGMVAEEYAGELGRKEGERIVGFMIYELHKMRLHILDFAVLPSCQRSGIGKAMLNKLKLKLSGGRRNKLSLKIRESNLDGQLFFANQGFRAVSIMREFYEETDEDAYLMQYRWKPNSEFACGMPANSLKAE